MQSAGRKVSDTTAVEKSEQNDRSDPAIELGACTRNEHKWCQAANGCQPTPYDRAVGAAAFLALG
jgi:hypothetical protein